jgi:peroxiredoxin
VQLQGDYEEITRLQTDIIAISTDDLSQASYVAESLRLDFPILYDPAADVVRKYGVYNLWEDGMATPSTFVLDRTGNIQWQHIGKTVYDRPSNEEIIDQLRKLPEG